MSKIELVIFALAVLAKECRSQQCPCKYSLKFNDYLNLFFGTEFPFWHWICFALQYFDKIELLLWSVRNDFFFIVNESNYIIVHKTKLLY
jgi:hypothetical protein